MSPARFLTESVAHAAMTGVWTAAGELPTGKRRAVRAGVLGAAALSAAASPTNPATDRESTHSRGPDAPGAAPVREPSAPTPQQWAGVAAGVVASAAVFVGGWRLEKRWLASLARGGHPHPHRALGVRMAVLSLTASVAIRLLEKASSTSPPTGSAGDR